MPLYDFENTDTGEQFEEMMSWSALQAYLHECPHLKQLVGAPKIVTGVGSHLKVDDGYRDVISRIKETHRINNITDH